MGESKMPRIRFKGFSDDWVEKKLGECFNERNERSAEGELISVTINSGVVRAKDLNKRDNSSEDKSKYKKVEIGDIAYNSMRMWQGASGFSKYKGILSPAYTVVSPMDNISSNFFSFVLKKPDMIQMFQNNSQGVTSDTWNLKFPAFSEILTKSPEMEEQIKIGEYLKNIDNLILQKQKKYDKLVKMKTIMLEKMFPKGNASEPEVRYGEFVENWKICKLRDIANKVSIKNIDLMHNETFTNSAEKGIISQREFFDKDITNSENKGGYYLVDNDNFVYNPRISVYAPFGPINRNKLNRVGIISPLYTVFNATGVDYTFLEYYFKSNRWHMFMTLNGDTGARSDRFAIKDSVFFQMPIQITCLAEQEKIGNYFKTLDKLISLQQKEIEKLKNIKKALLEKMFV